MTILLQRLFIVVFLFGTVFSVALGQGEDGSSSDSGGIFKNKSKVEGDGGHEFVPLCVGDLYSFQIVFRAQSLNFPCDFAIGLTDENGETTFSQLVIQETEGEFKNYRQAVAGFLLEVPEQECINDSYSISFVLDLYCPDENGEYQSIIPCESDFYDDVLPYNLEEECSLATDYSVSFPCCWWEPEPTPDPEEPHTHGRSSDCKGGSLINVFSIDGRNIYSNKTTYDSEEKINLIQNLNVKSGLYFIVTEKCGVVTTQKVFKN